MICPILTIARSISGTDSNAECQKENCAMWSKEKKDRWMQGDIREGHCGLRKD